MGVSFSARYTYKLHPLDDSFGNLLTIFIYMYLAICFNISDTYKRFSNPRLFIVKENGPVVGTVTLKSVSTATLSSPGDRVIGTSYRLFAGSYI